MDLLTNDQYHPSELSDQNIQTFVKENRNALIFIWSSQMKISINALETIKIAAKTLNLPLLIGIDPALSDEEVQRLKKKYPTEELQRARSYELLMRNSNDHFPVLFLVRDHEILFQRHPGAETSDNYIKIIQNALDL